MVALPDGEKTVRISITV